jgi:hypothetical protein
MLFGPTIGGNATKLPFPSIRLNVIDPLPTLGPTESSLMLVWVGTSVTMEPVLIPETDDERTELPGDIPELEDTMTELPDTVCCFTSTVTFVLRTYAVPDCNPYASLFCCKSSGEAWYTTSKLSVEYFVNSLPSRKGPTLDPRAILIISISINRPMDIHRLECIYYFMSRLFLNEKCIEDRSTKLGHDFFELRVGKIEPKTA